MQKRRGFVGIFCASALLWGGNAVAQKPDKKTQTELGRCYSGMAQAWKARDAKAVMQFWAPDYTEVNMKKQMLSRAAAEKQLHGFFKSWKYGIVMRYRITSLQEQEGGKTLTATLTQEGDIKTGPKPTDGVAKLIAEFRHVWRKTPQGWRLHQQKPLIDLKAMQRNEKAIPLQAK